MGQENTKGSFDEVEYNELQLKIREWEKDKDTSQSAQMSEYQNSVILRSSGAGTLNFRGSFAPELEP